MKGLFKFLNENSEHAKYISTVSPESKSLGRSYMVTSHWRTLNTISLFWKDTVYLSISRLYVYSKIKLFNRKPHSFFYVISIDIWSRQINGPPKMSPSKSLELVNMLGFIAKGEIILDYPGGFNGITRVLKNGNGIRRSERDLTFWGQKRFEDAMLMTLKREDRAMSMVFGQPLEARKGNEIDSLLEPPEYSPINTLI